MESKLQRWTDLLVALLRYRLGATFTDLARDVSGYLLPNRPTDKQKATVKRMFERDKAELLAFGVPIETIARDGGIEKYRLRPADFYLPYLAIVESSGHKTSPRRVDKDGYHSVQELAFEPDELAAIGAAASMRGRVWRGSLATLTQWRRWSSSPRRREPCRRGCS